MTEKTVVSSYKRLAWFATIALAVFCQTHETSAEPLRIGLQPFLSYAPTFVALDKGYFRDEGLDVKTTMIRGGGTAAFNECISGQLDICSGAITASFLNAVIKGVRIKVIADKGQIRKGHNTNELWVGKTLYDAGLKNAGGLRGKTVATAGPGSSDWILLGLMLKKYGLSLSNNDVLAALLPGPERPRALESGTVAGAILVEPFISSIDHNKAALLTRITDIMPVFQTAVFYARGDFLQKHSQMVRKFLAAMHKATKLYMQNPKSDAMLAILSKYTKVSPSVIRRASPAYFSPDGKIDVPAVRKTVKFLFDSKLISRSVHLKEFVDKGAM